jgi:hypothetical protein
MAKAWRDYQETTASFFRSLGLQARTDVSIQGVRTAHDIDVVVTSHHVGFEITWLVECKHWQTPVSKLHVLALRAIVTDIGADRGILLCEVGFQSGAIEAAQLTNVHVSSLDNLKGAARTEIIAMRLRELYDRAERCRGLYWDIPKDERIARGLRSDVGFMGYSGTHALNFLNELFLRAFRGEYPITLDVFNTVVVPGINPTISSPEELIGVAEPLVSELEAKLK